jgi:8-oxo-dGTP pyrophosphatase MutT (NUDIX family)
MAFEATNLAEPLRDTLIGLNENPYPYVDCTETKRRASVALILRIRPHYKHWPTDCVAQGEVGNETPTAFINRFFAQDWVQNGDAEVIFIKRAARVGDRWTSHVALPGGKRDPEDEDDKSVAIRETEEEIGLDLTSPHAFYVGNLPERVVSTSFGKVP